MLHIDNLKAGYKKKAVVELPSLSLGLSDHCLILGKSGSGKTTLLYAIAGLLRPITGDVIIAGTNIARLSVPKRDAFRGKHIGIVYQTLHMVNALSVLQNVLLASYCAGTKQDIVKAEAMLGRLGLAECMHRLPEELSQGQQQRVAIARAAIGRPTLILGDEPTSALDDEHCDMVMRLLLSAAESAGASLIIATHDVRVKKYFTRTIVLGGHA